MTNDPYSGAQHLNDIVLFTPIFHAGRLEGFSASIGHHIDVGGGAAGPNAGAADVFSEGLRIPAPEVRFRPATSAPMGCWSSSSA
jgi:N-methylhydantoinase B